jgi:signal peptidase I
VTDNFNNAPLPADQQEPTSVKSVVVEEALSWAKLIIFTVTFAVLLNQFVIVNASIPTGSMENVIMPNDRIVAFRLSYLFSDPARYDIIIFRYPDDESRLYVKRIIGMPGETVVIRDGRVYIDGSDIPLRDDFIKEHVPGNYGPFVVPENHYFVLGDNRGNSEDSRAWRNPFVNRDRILGRAVFKYHRGVGMLR